MRYLTLKLAITQEEDPQTANPNFLKQTNFIKIEWKNELSDRMVNAVLSETGYKNEQMAEAQLRLVLGSSYRRYLIGSIEK